MTDVRETVLHLVDTKPALAFATHAPTCAVCCCCLLSSMYFLPQCTLINVPADRECIACGGER